MFRGETFTETAIRHCQKSGIQISTPRYIGTFPVKFPTRHDITMCMVGEMKSGIPKPTKELTRYRWYEIHEIDEISPIGGNYKKMLRHWKSKFFSNDSV